MVEENPYSAPDAIARPAPPPAPSTSTDVPSPLVIGELVRTRPWVRFLSIVSWVGIGFVLLAALFLFGTADAGTAGAINAVVALVYGFFGLVLMYPALKLGHFASRIDDLVRDRTMEALEKVLPEQRRVWKFYGILTAIYLAIVLIAIGFAALGTLGNFLNG